MKKILRIWAVLLLVTALGFSQGYKGRGRLAGVITDMEGNPLEGVTVKLVYLKTGTGFETKSDNSGEWNANWIGSGMWYIDFAKVGYEPKKISLRVNELSRNPDIEIKMKKVEGLALTSEIVDSMNAANTLYDAGRFQEAVVAFESILRDNPDAFIINQNIGNAYFALEDYDKAIEFYLKALEKQEDSASLIISVGNAYINKKEDEKAMEWYGRVKVEDIDDAIALYNMGILFFKSGNGQKAIPYFQRAVNLDEEFADGYYQLAMSYLQSGITQEAVVVLEKFLELEPESERSATAESIIATLKKEDS